VYLGEDTMWMVEAIDYYRRHDFFGAVGTAEWVLVDLLRLDHAREARLHTPDPIGERWPHRDSGLLALDEERVLDLDFEVDAVGGSTMYVATIPRIARITRGVFSAWDISEEALGDERWGPVRVQFRVAADVYTYELGGGRSDWLDGTILWVIEDFMRVSPFRLYAASDTLRGSQGGMFAALTKEERDAIDQDRGLVFVPLPDEPAQPWDWDIERLVACLSASRRG
jgi:hypothetical protein